LATKSETGTPEHPTVRGAGAGQWRYAAKRAQHGFVRHRGIDSAAALAYFAALTAFPASLAIVSAIAIYQGKDGAYRLVLSIAEEVLQPSTVEVLREPLEQLFSIGNPGIALGIGLLLSLWTLSGYSTAFGRAVNTAYEVLEGRALWKFRGLMLLVAAFLFLPLGAAAACLIVTPNILLITAGDAAEPWVLAWSIVRWPLAIVLIGLAIAVLYYATPNVRHERIRWVSHGALFAIVVSSLATAAMALYVSTVAPYDRIYGWLGGGLAVLLWLYIINLVAVFGAEVDAEVMRLRQLNSGIPAEETVQVPVRDTTRNLALAKQRADDIAEGRGIRESAQNPGN